MLRKQRVSVSLCLGLLLSLYSGMVQAQTPRPTPTNVPGTTSQPDDELRGTIQGVVYQDVNGDGRCVDTGVAGENPVEGVTIEFLSSDEETALTLTSGPDGKYGLFAAGQSYWSVSAKPAPGWIVTSESPLFAPIFPDSRVQTGINFCIQQASATAIAVLPAAGAPANPALLALMGLGLGFLLLGFLLRWREHTQSLV